MIPIRPTRHYKNTLSYYFVIFNNYNKGLNRPLGRYRSRELPNYFINYLVCCSKEIF